MLKAVATVILGVAPVMSSGAAVLHHPLVREPVPAETYRSSDPCWALPVTAEISDGYRPPACRWCPGNRGLEFASTAGDEIRAPVDGHVTFDGDVAGRRYLTIAVAVAAGGSRMLVTLGGLEAATPARAPGSLIARGEVLGAADGPVHLGVRIGTEYVDPDRWLSGSPYAPVLLPLDGGAPRQLSRRTSCS